MSFYAIYRVVKTTTNDFGPHNGTGPQKVGTEVIWEGTSVDELSRAFPPSDVMGADPLGHSEIEDGLIKFDYTIQQRATIGGSWLNIGDPRTRVTSVTRLEREIDAENRRLYPGDYATDEDECPDCGRPDCQGECAYDRAR